MVEVQQARFDERIWSRFGCHLPAVRLRQTGDDAHRRMPVLLRVRGVQSVAAPRARRLLRLLLIRVGEVPADADAG